MLILPFSIEDYYLHIDLFGLNATQLQKEELSYFSLKSGIVTLPLDKHDDVQWVKDLCNKTLSLHHRSKARKEFVTKLWAGLTPETWKLYWDYAEYFYGFIPGDYIDEKLLPKELKVLEA